MSDQTRLTPNAVRSLSARFVDDLSPTDRSRFEAVVAAYEHHGDAFTAAEAIAAAGWQYDDTPSQDTPSHDNTGYNNASGYLRSLFDKVNRAAVGAEVTLEVKRVGDPSLGAAQPVAFLSEGADEARNDSRETPAPDRRITDQIGVRVDNETGAPLLRVALCYHPSDGERLVRFWQRVVEHVHSGRSVVLEPAQSVTTEDTPEAAERVLAQADVVVVGLSARLATQSLCNQAKAIVAESPKATWAIPLVVEGLHNLPEAWEDYNCANRGDGQSLLELAPDEAEWNKMAIKVCDHLIRASQQAADPLAHRALDRAGIHPADLAEVKEKAGFEDLLVDEIDLATGVVQPGPITDSGALEQLLTWARTPLTDKAGTRLMALLGEYGTGKTVTAQMLDQTLREAIKAGEGELPQPYLFDLRRLTGLGRAVPSVQEIMATCMQESWRNAKGRTPQDLLARSHRRPCLFIFDGLDEAMVNYGGKEGQKFLSNILSLLPLNPGSDTETGEPGHDPEVTGPETRLLVTCRDHFFADVTQQAGFFRQAHREQTPRYTTIVLRRFTPEQVRSYLTAALPEGQVDRVLELFDTVHDLTDLTTRPFTLAQLVEHLPKVEAAAAGGGDLTVTGFYRLMVGVWLARDGEKHQILLGHKHRLFPRLAAWAWAQGSRSISCGDMNEWFWDAVGDDPVLKRAYGAAENVVGYEGPGPGEKLEEDLRTATFLVRHDKAGVSSFRFAHTSFQEYFVAEYLANAVAEDRVADWAALAGNEPSAETLAFLGDLLAEHPERERLVATMQGWRRQPSEANRLLLRYAMAAKSNGWPGPTLAGFVVHNANLEGWHFTGDDGALLNLANLDLTGCNLRHARFHRARLAAATFSGADARFARFDRCLVSDATFTAANLSGSWWHHCRVSNQTLGHGANAAVTEGLLSVGDTPENVARTSPPARPRALPLELNPLGGHTDWVRGVVVDDHHVYSASDDNTVRVWDKSTGECVNTLTGHTDWVRGVVVDDHHVYSASDDNTVRVWDKNTGECVNTLTGHTNSVLGVVVDDHHVYSASHDKTVRVWDKNTGECVNTLTGHTGPVLGVVVDDHHVYSASDDKTVRVWDKNTGECVNTLTGHTGPVLGVVVDDHHVYSASGDKTVRVWDKNTGECVNTLTGHTNWVRGVVVDDHHVYSASDDKTVRVWDKSTGECVNTLTGHTDWVRGVVVDDHHVYSASSDNTVRVWDKNTGECVNTLTGHTNWVRGVVVDDHHVYSASHDNTVRVWDKNTGECVNTLTGHTGPVLGVVVDDHHVYSASDDNTVRVWDKNTGECVNTLTGHTDWVRGVVVDDHHVYSASSDKTVRVWDKNTGECVNTLTGHTGPVWGVVVDDHHVYSASHDNTVRVWDKNTGECVNTLTGHTNWVRGVVVDDHHVYSASHDNTVRVWDKNTGECVNTLTGHTNWVRGVVVDDHHVYSASHDNTVRVWDKNTGECVNTLTGHTNWVRGVVVDDHHVYSASHDNTVRVWDKNTGVTERVLAHLADRGWAAVTPEPFAVTAASDNAWEYVYGVAPKGPNPGSDTGGGYHIVPYEQLSQAAGSNEDRVAVSTD